MRRALFAIVLALVSVLVAACGGGAAEQPRELVISAIPDQDPQKLQRLYGALSERLTRTLGVPVRYVPLTDYAASVTSYRRGDLDMVFFGGLTGVQARQQVPGSVPLAQRDVDERFRSVFIATTASGLAPATDVAGLREVGGRSLTFGSESSTSGRLMPQYFLDQAGVGPNSFRGPSGFSGSHDATIALVTSGAYEVGALNATVWDQRVAGGGVDTTKVREIFRTPTYHDYHWLARPDIDEQLGAGTTDRIRGALLALDPADPADKNILDLFGAGSFIPTQPANYDQVEQVGRSLGLVQ
ncbi:putative selenate ABC transporter substrate-binding protein [Actinomycetospora lutea]|uniref:putative selenate ABC transporter substrate-binding protein n=1 Tax=Actinomycetospora lutea TaxID=663604 RepID=UPI0023659071|nr:putative selenate ABC transporter substrate-binding protein [Actinomycetospora lutea]MDD7941039.1 putative selenate ABC transporter substrate-binding protein [Actinomycetospora lutea]